MFSTFSFPATYRFILSNTSNPLSFLMFCTFDSTSLRIPSSASSGVIVVSNTTPISPSPLNANPSFPCIVINKFSEFSPICVSPISMYSVPPFFTVFAKSIWFFFAISSLIFGISLPYSFPSTGKFGFISKFTYSDISAPSTTSFTFSSSFTISV